MNTYKSLSVVGEHYYGEGVNELDLSAAAEQDALSGGHLEIVPRDYRVLSDNYSAGEQGAVVSLALLKEHEAALLEGGHLERVDTPASKGGSTKKTATPAGDEKKED